MTLRAHGGLQRTQKTARTGCFTTGFFPPILLSRTTISVRDRNRSDRFSSANLRMEPMRGTAVAPPIFFGGGPQWGHPKKRVTTPTELSMLSEDGWPLSRFPRANVKNQVHSRRRVISFRLRTLLGAITILGIILGCWAHRANRQRLARKWVEEHGGHVVYDFEVDEHGAKRFEYDEDGNTHFDAELPYPAWVQSKGRRGHPSSRGIDNSVGVVTHVFAQLVNGAEQALIRGRERTIGCRMGRGNRRRKQAIPRKAPPECAAPERKPAPSHVRKKMGGPVAAPLPPHSSGEGM